MIRKLNSVFTKKVCFVLSVLWAALILGLDAYNLSTVYRISVINVLAYASDLLLAGITVLYAVYILKDRTRKASKLLYLIIGYLLFAYIESGVYAIKSSFLSFEIAPAYQVLHPYIKGAGYFLLALGLCGYLVFKLMKTENSGLFLGSMLLLFLSALATAASLVIGIFLYRADPYSFTVYDMIKGVCDVVLPFFLIGQCVLSQNREQDFDEPAPSRSEIYAKAASLLNRNVMLVLAAVTALLTLIIDLTDLANAVNSSYILYLIVDFVSILLLLGLGVFTFRGEHSRANKTFYLLMSYIVFVSLFGALTNLHSVYMYFTTDLKDLFTTESIIRVLINGLAELALTLSVVLFVIYKLSDTRKGGFVKTAIVFSVLASLCMLAFFILELAAGSDSLVVILREVVSVIRPTLVLSQCLVTIGYEQKKVPTAA